jgi:L-threonylcarbamoyladenylate synthase
LSSVDAALRALEGGELVVIPTDTVYGLAARVDAPEAVAALFAAKGRPSVKPLPVLGDGIEALRRVVTFDARAEALTGHFWPGALTIVLPRAPGFEADLGSGGEHTVAVRVPANEIALELLRRLGPLAVSSANRSDQEAAVTVEQAKNALGEAVSVFLNGGRLSGRPSTIVSLIGGELGLIREGEVPLADVQAVRL